MVDDDLLREILRSPLDGQPRSSTRWLVIFGLPAALLVVVIVVAALSSRDASTAVYSPTEAGVDAGQASSGLFPDEALFNEMVGIGESRFVMFGGVVAGPGGSRPFEGTWTFGAGGEGWSVSHPDPAPSPRYGQAMAYHSPTGKVVLFGGGLPELLRCPQTRFCTGPENDEVWQYDPATSVWEIIAPRQGGAIWPAPRSVARWTYEPITGRLIMFGGVSVTVDKRTPTFFAETWAYDPVTNIWELLATGDGPNG